MHKTAPNNGEVSDPNIVKLRFRNSAASEVNNWVPGHLEFRVLQGKLADKQGPCADGAGQVIGVFHHFCFGGWFSKQFIHGSTRRFFSGEVQ